MAHCGQRYHQRAIASIKCLPKISSPKPLPPLIATGIVISGKMVWVCAVPKCKTRSKKGSEPSENEGTLPTTMHRFPLHSPDLLAKWMRAIPRKNFKPKNHDRICSLHFVPQDFVRESTDSNKRRKRTQSSLTKHRLNDLAIPSKFPSLPAYLSVKPVKQRSVKAMWLSRFQADEERLESQVNEFMKADEVTSLEELKLSLSQEILPANFGLLCMDNSIMLIRLAQAHPEANYGMDRYLRIEHDLCQ